MSINTKVSVQGETKLPPYVNSKRFLFNWFRTPKREENTSRNIQNCLNGQATISGAFHMDLPFVVNEFIQVIERELCIFMFCPKLVQ